MKTTCAELVETLRREALRADQCGPPLIANHGDAHYLKKFKRHVGLHDCVRLMFFEDISAQLREPFFLVRARFDRTRQLLFGHD